MGRRGGKSDMINKKQKLDTEYNVKTALSLHPTDYRIILFYQTIFFHFRIKTEACWLPYRISHWVKWAGTYMWERSNGISPSPARVPSTLL